MKLPIATVALVAATLVGFAVELAGGGLPVCAAHGLVPAHLEPGALLTHLLLHDPEDPAHLVGNAIVLAAAGAALEAKIGAVRLLTLYLCAGVLGGLLHVLVDPASTVPLVGASGAVAGVLAVLGALRPRLCGFVAGFVLVNLWGAFTGAGGGVSFATHLGGFAAGALFVAIRQMSARRVEEA